MSITFKVCEKDTSFKTNTSKLEYKTTIKQSMSDFYQTSIESLSTPEKEISNGKGIVDLVHESFNSHRPLILNPDTIWIPILKGLATHIDKNAEELRKHFVNFEGKKDIIINRDSFIKGQNNPWENCFPEFSAKIADFIGKKRDLLISNFTTTTELTKIVSEIALMDAMKNYFSYGFSTLCGIPRITLEGTVDDWKNIKQRVLIFNEFGLSWWTNELVPVLDEFINVYSGNINDEFWKSFYNVDGGSGGPFVSGHIIKFYPYLREKLINNFKNKYLTLSNFSENIVSAPFVWNYHGTNYGVEFSGGIFGIEQEDDGSIRSNFGWCVRENLVNITNYPIQYLSEGLKIFNQDGKSGIIEELKIEEYYGRKDIELLKVKWIDGSSSVFDRWNYGSISEMRKLSLTEAKQNE
jgi:hypothetical protein